MRKKVARKKFEIHRGEMVLYFYSFDREANHTYQIKQHGKYNFEFTVTAFEFNVTVGPLPFYDHFQSRVVSKSTITTNCIYMYQPVVRKLQYKKRLNL